MKTTTITLYEYNELPKAAQEKALAAWREGNDYYFLDDYLNEMLHELLGDHGILDTNDTSKPGTKPIQVMYSLSCLQGDGCMFEGTFEFKGKTVTIKHSGHYYHSYSKTTDWEDDEDMAISKAFETVYQSICKELERIGYAYIEDEDSEERFIETCESNGYTFEITGVMRNA